MDVIQLHVLLSCYIPVARIHHILESTRIAILKLIILTSNRRPLLGKVICFLNKVRPTTFLIGCYLRPVLDRSITACIVRLGSSPILYQVWSYWTSTPTLTEWEGVAISLTATNTKVKSVTIGIANRCTPVCVLVKLDREQSLGILRSIILNPLEALTLGIIIILYSASVGISPEILILIHQLATRVSHTVIDGCNDILLRQSSSIRKFHRSQRIVSSAGQISQCRTIAKET